MRILLLSAYHAASHQQWCEGLITHFSQHDWTLLSLPPRYFNWRIRGNSFTWAFTEQDTLSKPYDLLIATSMVDLSSLRGMAPSLTQIPTLVYFHENQFFYPISKQKQNIDQKNINNSQVEAQLTSLYSALCADQVLFNTAFNRDTFLQGVSQLIKKLPDGIPDNILELLEEKSDVLPVPISVSANKHVQQSKNINSDKFTIVWNHRWEYDKGPDRLLSALQLLDKHLPLHFHIVGQQFRQAPQEFDEIKSLLKDNKWLGKWSFIEDREEYLEILSDADAVLSTAIHDFQGIAVLEAAYLGCTPIVPNRLAYPELFGEEYCYPSYLRGSNSSDPQTDSNSLLHESQALAKYITKLCTDNANDEDNSHHFQNLSLSQFTWEKMFEKYENCFEKTRRIYNSSVDHQKPE